MTREVLERRSALFYRKVVDKFDTTASDNREESTSTASDIDSNRHRSTKSDLRIGEICRNLAKNDVEIGRKMLSKEDCRKKSKKVEKCCRISSKFVEKSRNMSKNAVESRNL